MYKEAFQGEYLGLKCLLIAVKSEDITVNRFIQMPSLLSIYGLSSFEPTLEDGVYILNSSSNQTYVVIESYPGKIITYDDIPNFLMEHHPSGIKHLLYKYFCTLWYLFDKGQGIKGDIILYHDEELEKKHKNSQQSKGTFL